MLEWIPPSLDFQHFGVRRTESARLESSQNKFIAARKLPIFEKYKKSGYYDTAECAKKHNILHTRRRLSYSSLAN